MFQSILFSEEVRLFVKGWLSVNHWVGGRASTAVNMTWRGYEGEVTLPHYQGMILRPAGVVVRGRELVMATFQQLTISPSHPLQSSAAYTHAPTCSNDWFANFPRSDELFRITSMAPNRKIKHLTRGGSFINFVLKEDDHCTVTIPRDQVV